MTKKIIIVCACFAALTLAGGCTDTCEMIILGEKIEIAANPNLAEWIPRVAQNALEDEFLVVWTEHGAHEVGGDTLYNIAAQRLTTRGSKIDTTIYPSGAPAAGIILLPTPEHNILTNEYAIAFTSTQPGTGFDQFALIMDHAGTVTTSPQAISQKPRSQMHSRLAFNSEKNQYFVVYNSSESGSPDIKGIIVDATGTPVGDEIMINDNPGDLYNPYIVYNPRDDRYLVNWEDFRNVPTWEQNGEIYGALLDGAGNILVNNIAMIDDFGNEDEGDQRHNVLAYNADRNEYLACWTDMSPSLKNTGVRGRFVAADGSLRGPVFTIVDAAGPQMFPHAVYVPTCKKYFVVWEDGRNQEDTAVHWRNSTNIDIYGMWMSVLGKPDSAETVFCDDPGVQRYSSISYSHSSDTMMIVWQDVVDEDLRLGEIDEQEGQHIKETGGNVYGIVFGRQ